jgi:hypothetical protein
VQFVHHPCSPGRAVPEKKFICDNATGPIHDWLTCHKHVGIAR